MAVNHHQLTQQQFGDRAQAYLSSQVHSQGEDLERLAQWLGENPAASVLDLGCGAGHASFVAAGVVRDVTAYDLSEKMLAVVRQAASDRQLSNLRTVHGAAEALPFAEGEFDVVISRYSAHHWHDVPQALREVKRVLKPGGKFILMDITSPGRPVLDIWLQTIEALRDTSHVHNYASGEWLQMFNQAGLITRDVRTDRLKLEFGSWIARMRTPDVLTQAIRLYQQSASADVQRYFALQEDGSFTSDTIIVEVNKAA